VANQLWNRLEAEGDVYNTQRRSRDAYWLLIGFIAFEVTKQDEIGFMETTTIVSRGAKGKGKNKAKSKARKQGQKQKYVFDRRSRNSQAYQDYFNPDQKVVDRLLDIKELAS
jgi:meiosis-specific protein